MSILNIPCLKINLFNNAKLFSLRFPELANKIGLNSKTGIEKLISAIPKQYVLTESKCTSENGAVYTANVNGKFIHSKYNPIHEAEQILRSDFFLQSKNKTACVFYGLGLGYLPEMYILQNSKADAVIVEPDIFLFLFFLASRPLFSFFEHKNIALLLGVYPDEVLNAFEDMQWQDYNIFKQTSVMEVSASWFSELEILQKRRDGKKNINKNTLKKFGTIWTKNFFKNLPQLEHFINVSAFNNTFNDYSALIIAAGPSLNSVLPLIKQYSDKFIVIAADTAVRACLHSGITPDFILFMDAQYWNYLHIADMNIESSILITELAVYPPVFRKKTKATVLASSVFPFAKLIEEKIGGIGKIVTGGSVATACWDFARILGVKEIIALGLDLGFPAFKTHFKGSRFEEEENKKSMRFKTAESASHIALYSAHPEIAESYCGSVLTDARMKMYAWWFESKLAEFPAPKTFNLMPQGLKIPNMSALTEKEFLKKAEMSVCNFTVKQNKINTILNFAKQQNKKNIKTVLSDIKKELSQIETLVNKALMLSADLSALNMQNSETKNRLCNELKRIDNKLLKSTFNRCMGFDLLLSGEELDTHVDDTSRFYYLLAENIKILSRYVNAIDVM